jgi:preprotein translocase subunit SecD
LIRRYRGIALIVIVVALSVAALVIPEIKITAFSNSLARGDKDTVLGLSLGLDLQGGTHLVYTVIPEDGGTPTVDDVQAIRDIIEKRVNEFGVSEATVQELGNPPDRIMVQIPGQKGSSLSIGFRGGIYTAQDIQAFFRDQLNKPEAVVKTNDDGSLTVELDSIAPPEVDEQGNITKPGEAETWKTLVEMEFPAIIQMIFRPTPVDDGTGGTPTPEAGTATPEAATPTPEPATATPEATGTATPTPAPETVVPSLEDVKSVMSDAGFPEAEVSQLGEGFYEVSVHGLKQGGVDAEGNSTLSDADLIRGALREIGDLPFYSANGDIIRWAVGGGVEEAKALIGNTAKLEFRERICGDPLLVPAGVNPDEWPALRCGDSRFYTEQVTDLNADDLSDAFAGIQETTGQPVVNLVFTNSGGDKFFDLTDRIARNDDVLAIYLDGVELVAPRADQGISGGRAIISGRDITAERARTIAIQLRAGALPATLELVQERNIDATLGDESLRKSLIAGAIGLILLLIYMTLYYKVPGVLASVALVMYAVVLLAIFKIIPVTLTLSGAAAIILSLGFAVDANILIAERIKEELRTGRTLLAAINAGFNRAWPSIRDGNVSTLITAVVLYFFGDRLNTSVMQGFALTLGIGVLLSMFTAFFASRILLRLAARTWIGKNSDLFVPVRDVSHETQRAES